MSSQIVALVEETCGRFCLGLLLMLLRVGLIMDSSEWITVWKFDAIQIFREINFGLKRFPKIDKLMLYFGLEF